MHDRQPFLAFRFAAAGLACCLAASLAVATQVRPVNLEQMAQRASMIFSGTCVEVTTVFDPQIGRNVTRATFEVDRMVKGAFERRLSVATLSGETAGGAVIGLPVFRAGEQVVLFLYGRSVVGLQSPVGFGQGKFTVTEDKLGRRRAVNQYGNQRLLEGISAEGQVRLEADFDAWRGRTDLEVEALLDMADALRGNPGGGAAP